MASTLLAALWSVNTTDQAEGKWLASTMAEKLKALNEALAVFFRYRLANGYIPAKQQHTSNVEALFVTPEYFFAAATSDQYRDRTYLTSGYHDWALRNIPGPINTLLVPGSIAYGGELTSELREEFLGGVTSLGSDAPAHYTKYL